jgi:hypothetical protein
MNTENPLWKKVVSCIKERRLPWRLSHALNLLYIKLGLVTVGGAGYPTMDGYVEEQI